jgi:hypothetical protein
MYMHRIALFNDELAIYDEKRAIYNAAITQWPFRTRDIKLLTLLGTNWEEIVPIPERPCPPGMVGSYEGFRLKPSDVNMQTIDQDIDASEAIDQKGFGWNTVGELTIVPGEGKNYGVFGQGYGMPDAPTKAASKNSGTSLFPRGMILTVYDTDRTTAPTGSLTITAGAYGFDETLTLYHPADPVATIINPMTRTLEGATALQVLYSILFSLALYSQI